MAAYVNAVGSAVPETSYDQERILEVMRAWHGDDRRTARLLGGIYRASAIRKRHSVVRDFLPGAPGGFFYDPECGRFLVPGTAARNDLYAREAGALAHCAARRALERATGVSPARVTHLVTVSCTGFYSPGPDLEVAAMLGLRESVERYHIGFMGCYGAFPALRLARSLCLAHPEAVVLVVAVELCTLHLQAASDSDSLLAASVFADGAAAAVVTSEPGRGPALRLDRFSTALVREAAGEMAWTIGDTGFEMVLSSDLPRVVDENVAGALGPLLEAERLCRDDVGAWAVHPGGRAILDRVESAMGLEEAALEASREVLAEYGNMSSATVMFVLERLLRAPPTERAPVVAVAFGPGLSVESAVLRRVEA